MNMRLPSVRRPPKALYSRYSLRKTTISKRWMSTNRAGLGIGLIRKRSRTCGSTSLFPN